MCGRTTPLQQQQHQQQQREHILNIDNCDEPIVMHSLILLALSLALFLYLEMPPATIGRAPVRFIGFHNQSI